jgi:YD repeat-containing protein
MTRTIGCLLAVLMCVMACGCAKSDLTGPSDQTCRTYATQFTRQITTASFVSPPEVSTCRFDESSRTLTCEGALSRFSGCVGTLTTKATYRSTADFVDEASTVGRTFHVQDVESFFASCAESGTGTVNFAYDAQGRLTERIAVLPGSRVTAIYTAWDGSGRTTRGTVGVEGGAPCTLSIAYNDSARTMVTTATCPALSTSSVETLTYDTNGNIVRSQHAGSGREDSTEIRTIDRTDRVCTTR